MKNIIKILLILAVVGGIATVVITNWNSLTGNDITDIIPETSFEKHIKSRVDCEIKGKSYADASRAYQDVLGEIETESSVTQGNGQSALTPKEVTNCRKMAYYEYVPIFTKYADEAFKKSVWSNGEMEAIRTNAKTLLGAGIAENSSEDMTKVRNISKTVDEYFAALSVISSSQHCTSDAAVQSVISKAKSYQHAPLTNCSSLSSGLASVPSNAKNSYANSVVAYCNGVAGRYSSYGDYVSWSHAYEDAVSRINEYVSRYGNNGALSAAKSRLSAADDRALDHFSD